MKKEIVFISGNKGKIETAKRYFDKLDNVELKPLEMDLIEPQFDSVKDIAIYKAKQAYDIVKKPVFVLDSGFEIEELNGFPGAYAKYFNETIGNKGYLRLLDGIENRNCSFTNTIVYIDENGKDYCFESSIRGRVIEKEVDVSIKEAWSCLWKIVVLNGVNKTIVELNPEELNSIRDKNKSDVCWVEFTNFLKHNN